MIRGSLIWFLLVAGLLVAIASGWCALPARQWVEAFDAWFGALGPWGVVLFALAYVVAVVLLAPAEFLSIAAGFLFGTSGFPIVIVAATVGAALAFLVSRYAVRTRLRRLLQDKPRYSAIDRAVAEEGWKIVVLLRLNPLVPFNLQNYFFGATSALYGRDVLRDHAGRGVLRVSRHAGARGRQRRRRCGALDLARLGTGADGTRAVPGHPPRQRQADGARDRADDWTRRALCCGSPAVKR